MSPETLLIEPLLIKDRANYFLTQTILNPVNAQKLAPAPEIAQTPAAKQEEKEALTKTMQQIKDSDFTPLGVNSLLENILLFFFLTLRHAQGQPRIKLRG